MTRNTFFNQGISLACLLAMPNLASCKIQVEQKKQIAAKPIATLRQDSSTLAQKISLPHEAADIKWMETARSHATSRMGPTDTRLQVSFSLNDDEWRALKTRFGKPLLRNTLSLTEENAEFFPVRTLHEALGNQNDSTTEVGEIYDPSPLAKSWYSGVLAFRAGQTVYMEFVSN
jgi:hypothetical protein